MTSHATPATNPLPDGGLILAATPMGNYRDASLRLRDALGAAHIVAAEDTRRARALAAGLDVEILGRLVSFHDHNEHSRVPALIDDMRVGNTVLLVTDAGMPSVSDPGYRLVAAAVAADVAITCLPGPSAVLTALALSGLPMDRCAFDGFVPRKPGARKAWLSELVTDRRTVAFFESPHRLADTLADAAALLGDRRAAVCREMTKTFEEVKRGTLPELAVWAKDGVRGEITVVVDGCGQVTPSVESALDAVFDLVEKGMRLKDACGEVSSRTGLSKKELYDLAVAR